MNFFKTTAFVASILAASTSIALAQDAHGGHGTGHQAPAAETSRAPAGEIKLPEICLAAGEQGMGGMAMGTGTGHAMDEAHADLMKGMDEMNRQMMIGMMAEDIDVAFVCGMIPHHQSAVNMAKAQLEHGDDPWAKKLAQSVIENQEQEISDMFTWLEERAAGEIAE
ncbi:DUF305 domain-containing protein [Tianweitania sediminis]|uniref:DUF305 domain-containing protein n=1 Tax=Tianweitania sediminis TaxID=1502156 RepID=A0A8J7R1V4_9HYPH|nr:DUF305 domain-containing protein [Tianweitania sediminis]MBP0441293.1 DUF305 domain-containing protein [Tianweitania sediminis]